MGSEIPTYVEGPKLLARMRRSMRSAHYSERTEAAYLVWVRRFVRFHGLRHPVELRGRVSCAGITSIRPPSSG